MRDNDYCYGSIMLSQASGDSFWITDDAGFPKKGTHSISVACQYCCALARHPTIADQPVLLAGCAEATDHAADGAQDEQCQRHCIQ